MRDLNELKLNRCGSQITEERYSMLLMEFDLTLPQIYKEFILFKNGGRSHIDNYDEGTLNFRHSVEGFFTT